jgi:hypothetical protein
MPSDFEQLMKQGGVCAGCGKPINNGDSIKSLPSGAIVHNDSDCWLKGYDKKFD